MKIIDGLGKLKKLDKRSAVTIGVFDGVHVGHQRIIKQVVKEARQKSLYSVVITFDPNPREVINPGSHSVTLTGINLKLHLFERLGVDITLVINFNKSFAEMSASRFMQDVLVSKLRAANVFLGEGFRFGAGARGDMELLKEAGQNYDFKVEEIPLISTDDGVKISSTRIRNMLKEGKLDEAKKILGHRPIVSGKVKAGKGYGSQTGFHTANIETLEKASVPKEGVYAGFVIFNSKKMPSVINIGPSPTFDVKKKRIEIHIMEYTKELYGEELELELVARLRDIRKFMDAKALSAQIKKDIAKARAILSNA